MQAPDMQEMVNGLSESGIKSLEGGDVSNGIMAGSVAALLVAISAVNATLEEIRDAIKESN